MVDFAHEIESVKLAVELLQSVVNAIPYLITRIAPGRKNFLIKDFGYKLAQLKHISGITVYDKVDGKSKRWLPSGRGIGESSKILYNAILEKTSNFVVKRILSEQDALLDALETQDVIL
jgi:hypothetical protein